MAADFQALKRQFLGHWQAIEQAAPAERRMLVVELVKALAEWETAQVEPLERVADLKRTGHWGAIAQAAASESGRIAARLGEEKQALRQRLEATKNLIHESEDRLGTLTPEVETIRAELSSGDARLADLQDREAALRQRLAACQRLRDLRAEVDRAKAELGLLGDSLQGGAEPSGVLSQLASLGKTLTSYFEAYIEASRDIATQLSAEGTEPPSSRDILGVPERLLPLTRELEAIDRILAEQLRAQDIWDQKVKART